MTGYKKFWKLKQILEWKFGKRLKIYINKNKDRIIKKNEKKKENKYIFKINLFCLYYQNSELSSS